MTENTENKSLYNIEYILAQIAKIQDQTEYLNNAIGNLSQVDDSAVMSDIVKCRETTNQQILSLYEKMYDNLKPANNNKKLDVLERLTEIIADTDVSEDAKTVMLDTIRQIFEENFKD